MDGQQWDFSCQKRDTCAEYNTAHVIETLMRVAVVIDVAGRRSVTQLHRILLRSGKGLRGRCRIVSLRDLGKRNVA